jgi:hypothetical protein
MTSDDFNRMRAAAEKRRRKLQRYIDTPAAKARRLELECLFNECTPMEYDNVRTPHHEEQDNS